MVYIFGIDIPLIELLLVYSFIALYIIILMFLQLRKLLKLIRIEKGDIEEIEEKKQSPVDSYITNALKHGLSKKQIKNTLIEHGWDKKEIENVLVKY